MVTSRGPDEDPPHGSAADRSAELRKSDSEAYAIDWIRLRIAEGMLSPGTVTSAQRIAEKSGLKEYLVRRAVRALEKEGVLKSTPGRGVQILGGLPPVSFENTETPRILLLIPDERDHLSVSKLREPIAEWATRNGLLLDVLPISSLGRGMSRTPRFSEYEQVVFWKSDASDRVLAARGGIGGVQTISIGPKSADVSWDRVELFAAAVRHLLEQVAILRDEHQPAANELFVLTHATGSEFSEIKDLIEGSLQLLGYPPSMIHPILPPPYVSEGKDSPLLSPRNMGRLVGSRLIEELLGDGVLMMGGEESSPRRWWNDRTHGRIMLLTVSWPFTIGVLESLWHFGLRVPAAAFLCVVDESCSNIGSFTSSVQPDLSKIAARVCMKLTESQRARQGQPVESERTELGPVRTFVTRHRRSSNGWLHKLWRGLYGNAVIKDRNLQLRHANPAFEHFVRVPIAILKDQKPSQYWLPEIGRQIESWDSEVYQTGAAWLTREEFASRPTHSRSTFTFRFRFRGGESDLVGTLGFQLGKDSQLLLPPNWSNGEQPTDPGDALLEAYFEALPCSVLVEDLETRKTIYCNSAFRSLWPQCKRKSFLGLSESDYMKGDPGYEVRADAQTVRSQLLEKVRKEGPVPLQDLEKQDPPLGANGRRRSVLYFFLYDSFFKPVALASVGWDQEVVAQLVQSQDAFYGIRVDERGFPLTPAGPAS